ncbi:MAG: serine/threonine protein kinase [Desulfurococcaceae archaeon]|nr:serine/threonine protein kinase [Desulfurococcaceae archaeon]
MNIGALYRSLVDEDFKVLAALEKALVGREHAPVDVVERLSGIHGGRFLTTLRRLHKMRLVRREVVAGATMLRLTYLGYDMLALRALVRANVLEAIDGRVGVGKESEIYLGLAPGGTRVAVKFLRIGRASFRQTRRLRAWARDRSMTWYEQSKVCAEREFKALQELHPLSALVPRPVGYSRHVVVTEFIDGVELYERPELEDPGRVLDLILETVSIAYHRARIVHGDLSEYNIMVRREDEVPFIIDWPQYVYRDDPTAPDLLRRDVHYVVKFFNKVYRLRVDPEEALRRVLTPRG